LDKTYKIIAPIASMQNTKWNIRLAIVQPSGFFLFLIISEIMYANVGQLVASIFTYVRNEAIRIRSGIPIKRKGFSIAATSKKQNEKLIRYHGMRASFTIIEVLSGFSGFLKADTNDKTAQATDEENVMTQPATIIPMNAEVTPSLRVTGIISKIMNMRRGNCDRYIIAAWAIKYLFACFMGTFISLLIRIVHRQTFKSLLNNSLNEIIILLL